MPKDNPTITPYNIIVFGDPKADSKLVIELARGRKIADPLPQGISDPQARPPVFGHTCYAIKHDTKTKFYLYDTVGLSETAEPPPDPKAALDSLHQLAYNLGGEANLLVYVVCKRPETTHNYQLFHDIFCQKNVPLIVITTASTGIEGPDARVIQRISTPFPPNTPDVLEALQSIALPSGFQFKRAEVLNALQDHARSSRKLDPMEWFTMTAMRSWTLLGREAIEKGDVEWRLRSCYEALLDTLQRRARLSSDDAREKCEEVKAYMKRHFFRNVILFGNAGVGKSSIINMLNGKPPAESGSTMVGVTLKSKAHHVEVDGYHYQIHDTVGFNKTTIMQQPDTMSSLYRLVLEVHGGVGLLVYVIRGRIDDSQVADYKLFHKAICHEEVPIALVVTGLEEEESLEEWWILNEPTFKRFGMNFNGYACITATKGKLRDGKHMYEKEFQESRDKMERLLNKLTMDEGWKLEPTKWTKEVGTRVWNMFAKTFNWKVKTLDETMRDELIRLYGCQPQEAAVVTNSVFRRPHLWRNDSK